MAARDYRPRKPGWRQFTPTGYPRCQATARGTHTRDTGAAKRQCGAPAKPGLAVCWRHGGASPQAKAKSTRYLQEVKLMASRRRFGLRRDIDPAEALLEEVQHLSGECVWLREVIDRDLLQHDDPDALGDGVQDWRQLVGGPASTSQTVLETGKEDGGYTSTTTTVTASMHPLWSTYERSQDRLVKASTAALAAGLAERSVRLAETQGQLVATAVRAICGGLLEQLRERGLPADLEAVWPVLVGQVVPDQLRALAGSGGR